VRTRKDNVSRADRLFLKLDAISPMSNATEMESRAAESQGPRVARAGGCDGAGCHKGTRGDGLGCISKNNCAI
jgi:hypothetical protein